MIMYCINIAGNQTFDLTRGQSRGRSV